MEKYKKTQNWEHRWTHLFNYVFAKTPQSRYQNFHKEQSTSLSESSISLELRNYDNHITLNFIKQTNTNIFS